MKKFDCIIMNPPYSKHLEILAEAITHLKDENSVCVNLSPIRWIQDPLAKFKKNSDYNKFEDSVAKHIKSVDVIKAKEASSIFLAGFWEDVAISEVGLTNTETYYSMFAKNYNANIWPLIEKIGMPLYFGTFKTGSVYDKFFAKESDKKSYWIKCSRVHGHPGKKDEFDCITPQLAIVLNKTGHEGREVYFNTKDEAINFFKTMNSLFYKFIKSMKCSSSGDFNKGLPWLGDAINPRTGLKGYLSEWTEEDFYQYFNITPEEQKIIEETMEKYK